MKGVRALPLAGAAPSFCLPVSCFMIHGWRIHGWRIYSRSLAVAPPPPPEAIVYRRC